MSLFLSVSLWSGQIWSTIFYKVPPIVFWTSVKSGNVSLTSTDLTSMLIKAVVFGLLISIIACGYGLTTKGGPKEVGTSTTGAVVMTLVTVSLMDVLLTQILFDNSMFRTKSKKEEPVISPSFQLPIILIILSFMLLLLNIGSLPTIVSASFAFLLLQSFTLRIKITNDDFIVLQLGKEIRTFPFKN